MTTVAVDLTVPFLDLRAAHDPIADELAAAWMHTQATAHYVGGPEVTRFEEEWAVACHRRHAVGVANGTDALELTLRALGIGPGDEVVVPTNTFVATAEAVVAVGARPRFVDVDPDSLLITAEALRAAIGPRTAAVMIVHLFGHLPDMTGLLEVARTAGIAVVEDAAQAHGARRNGKVAGSFGDAACFSFYPGKNLGALGDAGAVVTDDARLADRIRVLANHGRGSGHHDHVESGRNSRLDALQAAALRVKLHHLAPWNEARRAVARRYDRAFAGTPIRPVAPLTGVDSAYHLYPVRVAHRDAFRAALDERGVQSGIHYPIPCHRTQAFAPYANGSLPAAEQAAGELVSLPMFPQLTDLQVARVVSTALAAVAEGQPA